MRRSTRAGWHRVRRNWGLYLLLLPSLILLILFAYKPMYGVVIAFKDYKNTLGITGSPWANPLGKYFLRFFNSYQFNNTIRNTLEISIYGLIAGFPIPIALALLINQMQAKRFRRGFQTVIYLPHFISTVVMVGLILIMFSPDSGLIGAIYRLFGKDPPNMLASPGAFSSMYVWTDVWQHAGWDSIIYIAALSAVDPTLYEAATVDGATRWQKLRFIDFPLLLPTCMILLILRAGNIMNVGFEKVYLMQNPLNATRSELISTYVYKIGMGIGDRGQRTSQTPQYSLSAAVSLFNNVINFILLIAVNQISKKVSENSLW